MTDQIDSHIHLRYSLTQKVGKGAYGVVWKAIEKLTGKTVAVKKVFDTFNNVTDAQRTYREVCFLRQLKHQNIVQLQTTFPAVNQNDLYMVFEYMETDLHVAVRANVLEQLHRRYIMYQVLKAIKFLHTAGVIHRDLKPANILLDSQCTAKLADFGLARSVGYHDDNGTVLTEYVATRWFRSPEILIGSRHYSKGVDMWSLGCIMGEMIQGKALFPGQSTLNQLQIITELLGSPSTQDINSFQSQFGQELFGSLKHVPQSRLKEHFHQASEDEIDLMEKLFIYDPQKRITVDEALNHPYLSVFSNKDDEPSFSGVITLELDDNKQYEINRYRDFLYGKTKIQKKISVAMIYNKSEANQKLNDLIRQQKYSSIDKKQQSVSKEKQQQSIENYQQVEKHISPDKDKQLSPEKQYSPDKQYSPEKQQSVEKLQNSKSNSKERKLMEQIQTLCHKSPKSTGLYRPLQNAIQEAANQLEKSGLQKKNNSYFPIKKAEQSNSVKNLFASKYMVPLTSKVPTSPGANQNNKPQSNYADYMKQYQSLRNQVEAKTNLQKRPQSGKKDDSQHMQSKEKLSTTNKYKQQDKSIQQSLVVKVLKAKQCSFEQSRQSIQRNDLKFSSIKSDSKQQQQIRIKSPENKTRPWTSTTHQRAALKSGLSTTITNAVQLFYQKPLSPTKYRSPLNYTTSAGNRILLNLTNTSVHGEMIPVKQQTKMLKQI